MSLKPEQQKIVDRLNKDSAPLNIMSDRKTMRAFFIHMRKEFSPHEFCCFYLIQAYRNNPRKRMANFMIDNYLSNNFNKEFYPFVAELNVNKDFSPSNVEATSQRMKATYANIPMSFKEKKEAFGILGSIEIKLKGSTKPPSDLFDNLSDQVQINISDSFMRFQINPNWQAPDGGRQIQKFVEALKLAGWSPNDLGIWN